MQNSPPNIAVLFCSVNPAFPELHGEPQRVPKVLLLIFSLVLLSGCQGGATRSPQIPTPVTPADFSLLLSSTSVTIPQGVVRPPVTVSVNPTNSFASSVQITLANLPAGVTSNPVSPFTITVGANTSI